MDIASISPSNSISSVISNQVQDKNMEPSNTTLDSGSTGDTISDSGEYLNLLHAVQVGVGHDM